MKKIILVILTVLMLCSVFLLPSSALTVSDTYSDVTSTSSQAVNLVNYAANYESFIDSDFVIFCDSQNSYYIVWGDLECDGDIVTGEDIEYIHYFRSGSSGASYYSYVYGTDVVFTLMSTDYVCTSNLSEFGFKSAVYSEYELFDDLDKFLVYMTAFLFIITIIKLRGN